MRDFMEVLDFTINDLENEEQPEDAQAAKDFDFLLDSPSVKQLKKILSQKRFLLEKDKLLPMLKDSVESLDFLFRNQ